MMKKNRINSKIIEYKIDAYESTIVPQANDLNKISIIINALKWSCINEKDISKILSFTKRQGEYYIHALLFLNLVNTFNYGHYRMIGLSEKALIFFSHKSTNKKLKEYILNNNFLEKYSKNIKLLNKSEKINETTKTRRLNSLEAWRKWINE